MKYKLLTLVLSLAVVVACKNKPKDNKDTDSANADSPTAEAGHPAPEPMADAPMNPGDRPGVFFTNIKDGDIVKSPVIVNFGIMGMEVEPAGKINPGKGHHHIIIDGTQPVDSGLMVMKSETFIHYGNGQKGDTLELAPGKHTLTLQFADGAHQSYGKNWSSTIHITVE